MAAVAQSWVGRLTPTPDCALPGNDVDAEGEEDAEGDLDLEEDIQPSEAVTQADKSDDDAHAESEEEDEESSEEAAIRSKTSRHRRARDSDDDAVMEDASEAESASAEDDDESDKSSSEEGSAAAPEWDAGSDAPEDVSGDVATRNNCVFCGKDEEHDPSEEFEEYMACAVCGDNSHRQCARHANSLSSDD
ncbi:MAG: hypothetical protein Q9200_006537, partial [Gallowayella weberi]